MTHTSIQMKRRRIVQTLGAAATLGPFAIGSSQAQAHKGDIVIGAAQPITGVFSFAGVAMNMGLNDYCAWRNSKGGVAGRKLKYVSEDSGFKLDQSVAIFKKIMAAEKPSFFYGESTQWVKAITQDAVAAGTVMTSSTSLATVVADPVNTPQHFVPGPTYPRLHEILMEYIARTYSSGPKPRIAYVYADTEFGRDGIPGGKARAQKLGLQIVEEIVTKQSGIDVAPEVAKLRRSRPDIVIFQGYILSPMPEFVRQLAEAGLHPKIMGTAWGLDKPAYDALAKLNVNLAGASMYRYGHETDSTMINNMREHLAKNRPEVKHISPFYVNSWLAGMIFAEIAERSIKANKPLTLPHMKAALESMTQWDSGGIFGQLADLSSHQIPLGRVYQYDSAKQAMEPASGWIKV